MAESVIENISDTARWVAEYRAQESARPDALFHDRLAAGLAGERGRAIAQQARKTFGNGWFFIARTRLIDDLVLRCVAEGCERVVNLAAGFDTRPYRLDVPTDLEWIEVDLPALIAEKDRELAAESPRCKLTRRSADLADPGRREEVVVDLITGKPGKTLVITEGLLLYLNEPDVRDLATRLRAGGVRWWIADLIGPNLVRRYAKTSRENNVPVVFGPDDGVGYFEAAGWTVDAVTTQLSAAAKWKRLPLLPRLMALLPDADPRRPGRSPWSAVVRLRNDP